MQIPVRNPAVAGLGVAVKRRAAIDLAARLKVGLTGERMIATAVGQPHDCKVEIDGTRHRIAFDGHVGWRKSAARVDGEAVERAGYIKIYILGAMGTIGVPELREILAISKVPGRHLIILVADTPIHRDRVAYWFGKCETIVPARYSVAEVNELALMLSETVGPIVKRAKQVAPDTESSDTSPSSSGGEEASDSDEEED